MRLYTQEDFEARPEFTEPEILRTNLAALLLRLAADHLGDAESFPFIDPPDSRALADGYRLLQELEAMDAERGITARGRAMARLPLDPRLSRALLESRRFHAEAEVLAIVAGLSVPDARIPDSKDAKGEDGAASAFEDARSEFSALVRLWNAYRKIREGPRRELRRWCKERKLSLLRLSEWEDVHGQIADRAASLGIVGQRKAASYTAVHRALLAGFCTMVGQRSEQGDYLGTRGIRFHIFPGSPLKRRRPRWVMAANIVQTSRVFARIAAELEPMWIESAARHLCKREFLEPDWDEGREQVVARERITFLGLTLSANRVVNYGPLAPEESRLIFAREALVYGRLLRRPPWLERNDAALRAAELIEERLRVRDLLRPPEHFVEFYAGVLPRQVSSAETLEYFTRHLSESEQRALTLAPDQIFARSPDEQLLEQFPESISAGPLALTVDYRFAPGEPGDGATLRVPLLALPALTRAGLDAAIPGLVEPRIVALLRSLPKDARRNLIPIAATAQGFLSHMGAPSTDLAALKEWLKETRGVPEGLLKFDSSVVPAHLIPQVSVVAGGEPICEGGDLADLRRRTASLARQGLDARARLAYPDPWCRFEIDELPQSTVLTLDEGAIEVYLTLERTREGVVVRFEWSAAEAQAAYREGAVALARVMLERQARELAKTIGGDPRLVLGGAPYFSRDGLVDLLVQWAFRRACFEDADPPRDRALFEAAVDRGRAELYTSGEAVRGAVADWFAQAREIRRLLADGRARVNADAAAETEEHLARLLNGAGLRTLNADWLRQVPRYLRGEERRWQRLQAKGSEPPQILRELKDWTARYRSLEAREKEELRRWPPLDDLRLWIEEYRVSLYAQELKTLGPISAARLTERAAEISAWFAR